VGKIEMNDEIEVSNLVLLHIAELAIGFAMRKARALGALALMFASMGALAGNVHLGTGAAVLPDLVFPSTVSVASNATVNSLVADVSQVVGISATGANCMVQKAVTVNGTLVPGSPNVYQTNVPGIGVQWMITSGWNGSWSTAPLTQTLSSPAGGSAHYTLARLVVTGPVSAGVLVTIPSMTVTFSGSCVDTVVQTQNVTVGTAINGPTCNVTTTAVQVPMPAISVTALTSIGATAGSTPLNLGIYCSAGTLVSMTLTDAVDISNRSTTLNLAPGSTATGVGLQILNKSGPIAYGPDSSAQGSTNQWLAGTAAGGPMNIPLTARYVRTEGKLSAGTVNGLATFTMSYQ